MNITYIVDCRHAKKRSNVNYMVKTGFHEQIKYIHANVIFHYPISGNDTLLKQIYIYRITCFVHCFNTKIQLPFRLLVHGVFRIFYMYDLNIFVKIGHHVGSYRRSLFRTFWWKIIRIYLTGDQSAVWGDILGNIMWVVWLRYKLQYVLVSRVLL